MPEPSPPPHGRRWRRGRKWLTWTLVALAAFVAVVAAGSQYVVATTRGALAASLEAAPARGHVVVLGSRVFPNGALSAELHARLQTGLALYRAQRARKIIVSGAVRPGYDEVHPMAAWLVKQGVPVEDVILDVTGHRTAATMAGVAGMGVRSALVTTQAYHLPRALYLAHRAGIDAVGVTAPNRGRDLLGEAKNFIRERVARLETLFEVLLRGVRV